MNANPADSSTPTLVVFCRRPAHGAGKQRIAATIGAELTFELATHLLQTTLEDAVNWSGPVVIAPAEPTDQAWAEAQMAGNHTVCPQTDGNLGERINAVDHTLRATGAKKLVFIGSDAPLLNADYFTQAQAALQTHDIVLGAAEDGGVVLMGARCAWPELGPLPWSSHHLGKQLELLCHSHGLTIKYLPTRYDIDFARDLPRLHADLYADMRPARHALRSWLATAGFASDNPT